MSGPGVLPRTSKETPCDWRREEAHSWKAGRSPGNEGEIVQGPGGQRKVQASVWSETGKLGRVHRVVHPCGLASVSTGSR